MLPLNIVSIPSYYVGALVLSKLPLPSRYSQMRTISLQLCYDLSSSICPSLPIHLITARHSLERPCPINSILAWKGGQPYFTVAEEVNPDHKHLTGIFVGYLGSAS